MPVVMGRDELMLVAATAAATLVGRQLLTRCILGGDSCETSGQQQRRVGWNPRTKDIRPPFPASVVALLHSSALCYLSTVADGAPHLSLMNFTYLQDEEKIIMTTRRDTTKFEALLRLPRVAMLIHDFPAEHESRRQGQEGTLSRAENKVTHGKTFSITLYGHVREEAGAEAERLRSAHLKRHGSTMEQFICGENIAVIGVTVDMARICNDQDEVTMWSSSEAN